ncbi:MAG: beta-ketoacyl-[acyl-carrier-protein] synthase family protein [Rhodothermales bacterium]
MRPVITGIGMISALGPERDPIWEMLLAGRPRMGAISAFEAASHGMENCVVSEIADQDLEARLDQLRARSITTKRGRFRSLALAAAAEALDDAGLPGEDPEDRASAGIVMGTLSAGAAEVERIAHATFSGGKPSVADNLGKRTSIVLQDIARAFDLSGPALGVDAACASGAVALTHACRLVATGAPWCLAGGVEASIVASNVKLAHVLGIVPTSFIDEPHRSSRPFDLRREGYVPAEGACFLVLEDEAHARRRGARIYARITGFAEQTYTGHPTQLCDTFAEALMHKALRRADVRADQLGWINAHATSTRQGDIAEATAIGRMGEAVLCSAPKSVTGHLLGASGAFEAAFSALSLHDQVIPPTVNLDDQDALCPVRCVRERTDAAFDYVLSNSLGFGGMSCSIVFGRA